MSQDNSSFESLMEQVNNVMEESKKSKCFICDEFTHSEKYRCVKCNNFKLHDTIYVLNK